MGYYLQLYRRFMQKQIDRELQFKADLLIGFIGYAINSLVSYYVLFILLQNISGFPNWPLSEVLLLFGFVTLSRALWNFFFINTLSIGELIREGTLDFYLLKPINSLLLIFFSKIDFESMGEILLGCGMIGYYILTNLDKITWSFIVLFLPLLLSSVLCYAAIHLAMNSLCFYIKDIYSLNFIIWRLDETTRYPNSVYPDWLFKLLLIIPYGFIGYFPVMSLLGKASPYVMLLSIMAGVIFFLGAYVFGWKRGLKKYTGARG